ncbi:MAG: hypothetical protein HYU36_03120 [Planctomycetes bacterium]|nr:hypothetical protein [Planctomycetota bacterium]
MASRKSTDSERRGPDGMGPAMGTRRPSLPLWVHFLAPVAAALLLLYLFAWSPFRSRANEGTSPESEEQETF